MEQLETVLTCSICLQRFKKPVILPCQHTFCLRPCLEGLARERRVDCPVCRASHNLPSNGIDGFAYNLTIVSLLDVPKQTDAAGRISCKECNKTSGLFGNCTHCDSPLCSECLSNHSTALKNEVKETISKVRNKSLASSRKVLTITEIQERLEENERKLTEEVHQWYQQCVSALQSKRNQLCDRIKAFTNGQKRNFIEDRDKFEVEAVMMNSFCQNAEEQITRASKPDGDLKCLTELPQESKSYLDAINEGVKTEKYAKVRLTHANRILKIISEFEGIEINERAITQLNGRAAALKERPRRATAAEKSYPKSRYRHLRSSVNEEDSVLEMYRNKGRAKRCFGREGEDPGSLMFPCGIAVTSNDEIFVVDRVNHRIQVFSTSGNLIRVFGKEGDGEGEFMYPEDVCITSSNEVVVADSANSRLQVFSNDGRYIKSLGKGDLCEPHSVDTNSDGIVFVSDTVRGVKVFSLNGNLIQAFGESWLDTSSSMGSLAVTHDDKVIVSKCSDSNGIAVFDKTYKLMFECETVQLDESKYRVAADKYGNIVGCQQLNNLIQVFDKKGHLVTSFGSYGSESSQMIKPRGVAVLSNGDIVVSDTNNHRIQIF